MLLLFTKTKYKLELSGHAPRVYRYRCDVGVVYRISHTLFRLQLWREREVRKEGQLVTLQDLRCLQLH